MEKGKKRKSSSSSSSSSEGGSSTSTSSEPSSVQVSSTTEKENNSSSKRLKTTTAAVASLSHSSDNEPVLKLSINALERTNGIFTADVLLSSMLPIFTVQIKARTTDLSSSLLLSSLSVTRYLRLEDIVKCRSVCRWWCSVLSEDTVWRSLFLRTFGQPTPSPVMNGEHNRTSY